MAETSAPPRRLGEQLIDAGLITEEALARALELQKRGGARLGECLVELALLPEQTLLRFLAQAYHTRFVSAEKLSRTPVTSEVLDRVPVRMAEQQALIPILYDAEADALSLVMAEPQNLQVLEEVRLVAGVAEVNAYVGLRSAVQAAIRRHYYGDPTAFQTMSSSPRDLVTLADSYARAAPQERETGIDAIELARVLVGQAELRRREMRHHALGTASATRAVMERLGASRAEVEAATLSAYLHDLGKRADKHLTLLSIESSEEHRADARRTLRAPSRLLERARLPARTVQILGALYESWDGTGLPESRGREEIPLGARVLAAADAFEDLRHNPGNHTGALQSREDALHALAAEAGHLFDPQVVAMLERWARGELLQARLTGSNHRILWLDPAADAATAEELFAAGFAVERASDLGAARLAITAGIDLLLLETTLGAGDGFAAAVELRALLGNVPFVFLSRRGDPEAIEKGLVLGAADYVVAPAPAGPLAARLGKILSDRGIPPRPVAGSLDELPLSDLLRLLAASERTGTLAVRWAAGSVELGLSRGRIASARAGGASGERALTLLSEVQRADFVFDPGAAPTARELDREVETVVANLSTRAAARI